MRALVLRARRAVTWSLAAIAFAAIAQVPPVRAQTAPAGPASASNAAPAGAAAEPDAADAPVPEAPAVRRPVVAPRRAAVPLDYRIRPGDSLTLSVYGEPTLSSQPAEPLRVLPGGAIVVPLVGEVVVAGHTPTVAGTIVAQRLRRYLRSPRVTLAVLAVGPVEALVLGNVKLPGKYVLEAPARVTDAIAAAGGLGPTDGDLPVARLQSPAGAASAVSLQSLLHDGDVSANVEIASGTTIYIPSPNLFSIQVLGAVLKPGDVELHDGDDLAMAVARAGASSSDNPDLNRVTVTRRTAAGAVTTQTINLYRLLKDGDASADPIMRKGDLVFVPQASTPQARGTDALSLLRRFLFF